MATNVMEWLKYIFNLNPGQQFRFYIPLFIIAGLLMLGSIAFAFIYKSRKDNDFAFKRIFKNTGKKLFWTGFLFLFLTTVRYEAIPYFSMRFLLVVAFGVLAYILYTTIKDYKVVYPREKQNVSEKLSKASQSKNKYLPNKKRK